MKKIILGILGLTMLNFVSAAHFQLSPEGSGAQADTIIETISTDDVTDEKSVQDVYNEEALKIEACENIGTAFAAGVFTWNSILCLLKHFVQFLSNVALVVAAATVIYAGYLYSTQVFTGNASKGKDAIFKSLQGLGIVIFAYAILKILSGFFLQ